MGRTITMKIWKVSLLVVVVIISIIFVFSRIAPSDQEYYIELVDKILDVGLDLGTNLMVVFYVFFSGAFAGTFWYLILLGIDRKVDVHINFTNIQMTLLTVLVAILFGLVYTVLFRITLEIPDTWIRTIATQSYAGWQPWSGEFDRSPVLWSFYGGLTFLLGFYLSSTILNPLRFRN
jgi:hypothetical protein